MDMASLFCSLLPSFLLQPSQVLRLWVYTCHSNPTRHIDWMNWQGRCSERASLFSPVTRGANSTYFMGLLLRFTTCMCKESDICSHRYWFPLSFLIFLGVHALPGTLLYCPLSRGNQAVALAVLTPRKQEGLSCIKWVATSWGGLVSWQKETSPAQNCKIPKPKQARGSCFQEWDFHSVWKCSVLDDMILSPGRGKEGNSSWGASVRPAVCPWCRVRFCPHLTCPVSCDGHLGPAPSVSELGGVLRMLWVLKWTSKLGEPPRFPQGLAAARTGHLRISPALNLIFSILHTV